MFTWPCHEFNSLILNFCLSSMTKRLFIGTSKGTTCWSTRTAEWSRSLTLGRPRDWLDWTQQPTLSKVRTKGFYLPVNTLQSVVWFNMVLYWEDFCFVLAHGSSVTGLVYWFMEDQVSTVLLNANYYTFVKKFINKVHLVILRPPPPKKKKCIGVMGHWKIG